MAKSSIAFDWLKANDPQLNPYKMRTVSKRRVDMAKRRKFVAYTEWDERALKRLEKDEARFRGLRHANGIESYSEAVRQFVINSVGFDLPECLLVPMYDDGAVLSPSPGLPPVTPARMMLARTKPIRDADLVCRHMCGNGHMGCINPRHLCWGTDAQNSADYRLHVNRPKTWPDVTPEQRAHILDSEMPHNVVAVQINLHAAVVEVIRRQG